jgi:hypothetical protein
LNWEHLELGGTERNNEKPVFHTTFKELTSVKVIGVTTIL